jgi:hypothetical protein
MSTANLHTVAFPTHTDTRKSKRAYGAAVVMVIETVEAVDFQAWPAAKTADAKAAIAAHGFYAVVTAMSGTLALAEKAAEARTARYRANAPAMIGQLKFVAVALVNGHASYGVAHESKHDLLTIARRAIADRYPGAAIGNTDKQDDGSIVLHFSVHYSARAARRQNPDVPHIAVINATGQIMSLVSFPGA